MKQISCFQELLILFWKLIDENKEFLSYILRAGDINELVGATRCLIVVVLE